MSKLKEFIKNYFDFIIILILASITRILASIPNKVLMWDDAVYLLNAKWFAGQHIYFEALRAPLLPFLFSFIYRIAPNTDELFFMRLFVIIPILGILVTYFVAKKLFGRKVAFASALFMIATPLHLSWGKLIGTDISGSLFVPLIIYFGIKGLKEDKYLYLSFLLTSLCTLTRYPTFILILPLIIFYVINHRLNKKNIIFSALLYLTPMFIWAGYNFINFGDPLFSAKQQLIVSGEPSPWNLFFTDAFNSYYLLLIVIIYGILYTIPHIKNSKELQLITLFIISFFTLHMLIPHKESRFLLPILPLIAIISTYHFKDLKNLNSFKIDRSKITLIVITLTFLSYTYNYTLFRDWSKCTGIIEISKNLSGEVTSSVWPLVAYYGNVHTRPPEDQLSKLQDYLLSTNSSYFIITNNSYWPSYVRDKNNFKNITILTEEESLVDNCGVLYTKYKVNPQNI